MIRGAGSLVRGRDASPRQGGLQQRKDLLPEGRSLVAVFVRDAERASHSRCETFADVESAEAFIQASLKRRTKQGFLAFWTVGEKPNGEATKTQQEPEVMVVIPDSKRPDLLYPLAFPDMESAGAFVQSESERWLQSHDASIYWTVPINISRDESGVVRLSPSLPPHTDHQTPAGAPRPESAPARSASVYHKESIDLSPPPAAARDSVSEVRRVLAVKRWQAPLRKSFSGFQSPQGRF